MVIDRVYCDWSYKNTTEWGKTWKQCAGKLQSPINIVDSEVATLPNYIKLTFSENFATLMDVDLTNSGKTAILALPSSSNISVSGNRLYINSHYKLEQVHFHWGDAHSGSEHKINSKSASMEVHLIHYNAKYESFKTARNFFDGILVLSTLVDVSTNVSQNSFWMDISDKVSDAKNPGSKTKLKDIKFINFLPQNKDDYYLYKGSFTTPPCFETVSWVVFKERLLIPEEYQQRFRSLKTTTSSRGYVALSSNIRAVKPLNSRTVIKTFQSRGGEDVETYVQEHLFNGRLNVITIVRFYQCHLPASVSLSIIIASSEISWKSQNLTSDIPKQEPLDVRKPYGVTLEMHEHPRGKYRDNVHVYVKLNNHHDVFVAYCKLKKDCLQDSCFWSTVGKSRTCARRLINTDETLLFTLTKQNQCDDVYVVTIRKNDSVIFKTSMKDKTRVNVTTRAADQQLKDTLQLWCLSLNVDPYFNSTSHAKLFLDIPYSTLSTGKLRFLMDGLYHNGPDCHHSGMSDHVKVIVGVAGSLFILGVMLLAMCLVFRNIRKSAKPHQLVQEDELADSTV